MKPILSLLILILSAAAGAYAQNAADDYDALSQLSSEQLMEEGRNYFEKRDAAKSLSRFLIVGERNASNADRSELETRVRALNNAACVYKFFYYDYSHAYEYFNRAYALCEEIGYDSFLPVIMVNMGDLLFDYGRAYSSETILQEAENLFKDCFHKAVEKKEWELLTTSFYNLSNLNYEINLKDFDEIFSKEIPADTPDIEFVRLQYNGINSMQHGNYSQARKYFERQLEAISTPWEAPRDTITSLINIAETYKLEKNYASAASLLEQALEIADRNQIKDLSAVIARHLSTDYDSLGNTAKAKTYYELYLENREELNNARLSSIGEMKYFSDLRKEEAKAQKIALRNQFLGYLIIALAIVLITILASAILLWKNYKTLKSRNQSLYEKYQLLLGAEQSGNDEKYQRSNLDDSRKESLLSRIRGVMDDPEYICRDDFTSKQLADAVGSNTTYVSQAINENYGVSFSTLLGNSRVKLVCRRISEGNTYDNLTIEGIANSVGFKSRTAFINAFKREVGLTPSQYIKMAATEKSQQERQIS